MLTNSEKEKYFITNHQATQILDGKWSYLVLGQLFYNGPQSFIQLRRNLDSWSMDSSSISSKSLFETLRHLEQNGIIYRNIFPTVPVTVEYSLTDKGRDFKNVLAEMRNWGQKWEDVMKMSIILGKRKKSIT
ncbi:winged helix-turn-helix transcriptional regulator [Shimazuella kribbensis]|uniref:winged helix-turn-helix transcriptional regulator n=1 Tax=Shimazuella kribbensis TaxID=139808 RepID=UPI0004907CBD|nr:winged helix-turn-helix transcriptional regulator [Shimazuella kribbensis]